MAAYNDQPGFVIHPATAEAYRADVELELIEPGLLMDVAPPHAAQHFARVIAAVAGKGN
jgi:hypothetical protein